MTVTGAHPPLVDQATFHHAGAIMDARGEDHTRRASNASDYHLTGRIRCPQCGKALIGTAAHGRNKTYRYYTCFSRARYGTTTCNAPRINADAMDEAIFHALTGFYRHHRDLIEHAVADATADHTAGIGDRRAELTTVEKELTRANSAIERYLQAFEDGDLDPATVKDRMKRLSGKITQLTGHRDELADLLSEAPVVPPAMVLDELTDHIGDILRSGSPAQRKALIEALVAEVKITGPATIIPVFRIPQPPATNDTTPADTEAVAALPVATALEGMVRTMVEPVGSVGVEPGTRGFSALLTFLWVDSLLRACSVEMVRRRRSSVRRAPCRGLILTVGGCRGSAW
ncbi:MAG: zinc ribbon domain-containing protein [Actinomycetota bacterium]|nr:zinc ribbon domain-containing protein [Actinomycetota bacterium]